MYTKTFEIRWSDTDANGHLANAGYVNFMSHTRMSYMMQHGISLVDLQKSGLGPVVFWEHIFYFKELFLGEQVRVSLELMGLSADGMFFQFLHNVYDKKGKNCARCIMMGAWIDLSSRQLTSLPRELLDRLDQMPRNPHFKILSKEDTRSHAQYPADITPDE